MAFTLTIDTDNAAFEGEPSSEVTRILQTIINRLDGGALDGRCQDYNGNTVGTFELDVPDTEEDEA